MKALAFGYITIIRKDYTMINVQIDEENLLDLLMQRVGHWTRNTYILTLYEQYLKDLINSGYFDGANLDIYLMIDNLCINNTLIMDKEDLKNNDIDINDSEKVLVKDIENDLYLVSAY